MIKKLNDILAGVPATLVGGVFLLASFILPRVGVALPVDPAWVTVVISGLPLVYLAVWRTIYNRGIAKISSAHLICVATIAAICLGDLFAAGEVAFIMAIGAILEDMTTERAKKGLKKLISLAPTQGRRLADGKEQIIPAEDIRAGDILRILPGETVAFDKTGTLTYGRLEVSDILPFAEDMDERALLTVAACAEAKSKHPLGKAIVTCAREKQLALSEPAAFRMQTGKGIEAELDGRMVLCGSENYLAERGIAPKPTACAALDGLRKQGKALILVAVDNRCVGAIALADVLREEAAEMVAGLARLNTAAVLLTGDNTLAARHFAAQAGIESVHAQLLPEQKVADIAALQAEGHIVCMIGDGVNDAPALKTADVGVAMGSMGSDIAVEAADIALMGDDLSRLPYLKRLSAATVKTIKGSITLSMCINLVAVTLSVLGVLNPTTGALVHNAGSCFVVLLAALLYDRKFD